MHDKQPNARSITSVVTRHRLWFPIGAGVLAGLSIALIRLQPDLERNYQDWLTFALVLLAVSLGLIWFLFLSRFPGRLRWMTTGLLALLVLSLSQSLRVDGTRDGTGLPRLAWRWTPPHTLSPPPPAPATSSAAIPVAGLPDVPQFFGPNRDGIVKGAGLARDWRQTPPKQLWRQPIGAGWSSFAVVAGRAYTQEQRENKEAVTCYDLRTGRLLWTHTDDARFFQWQGGEGPRATPTIANGHVFALGATGILNCLDAAIGQRLWSREVLKENELENLTYGVSCSPLVFDDTVVVTGGLTSGPTIIAYRLSTGEPLWRSGRDKASYASPVLASLAGRRVVLSVNARSLTAHDPLSGDLLLDRPWADDSRPKASQPVVLEKDRVFLSAGYGLGCVLLEVKAGADGKLAAKELWKNLRMKTQFNSAAARDGFLYGLDDGLLACVEINTGERKWKSGRYGSGQTLLVDDLVIIQSEPGAVALAEAKPEAFNELGRIPALSSKTWNHPTLAGRYLLLRNDREAVCYELPSQGTTPTNQAKDGGP
ncbi:MAG: PQQ-like beta-propeller repeat protein [Verrucomicrobiota bacterium]|nr:PQQ-like beta-propeller repeat protein [Verrucomicrobiota bacterium]